MLFDRFLRLFRKSPQPKIVAEATPVLSSPTAQTRIEPEPKPAGNPRELLADRCYQMGYEVASKSGAVKPDLAFLQTLEARAGALAQAAHVPASEIREQRRIARMKVLAEDHERQIVDRDRAGVYHAAELKKLSELGPCTVFPAFSKVFYYAAVVGLSISIAPTLHDLAVGLDPLLKWVAGGASALGVSLLIVHGILPGSPNETK